jgi:hypothetical protein
MQKCLGEQQRGISWHITKQSRKLQKKVLEGSKIIERVPKIKKE